MPRSGKINKRTIAQDPIYNSRLVSRLINKVMVSGKKDLARRIVYGMVEIIRSKTDQDPIALIENAIRNVSPRMEVRSRRIGGASYQVPTEVRGNRKEALAIRWLIDAARARPAKDYVKEAKDIKQKFPIFCHKLASEIMDAWQNQGAAIKKRDDAHRMAEANKAFAHFRW
ncbi:30S ribosomal protein S7 [Candidatus Daviesbacteria bacterium]|nr:30S ribosomal protein S7 [Candidatus Daviesbacteria bacterium]